MNVTYLNLEEFNLRPYRKNITDKWDGKNWIVTSGLEINVEVCGKIYRISIPKNFITDFGSVPKIVWNLISPYDAGEAAILHDFLYKFQIFSKRISDRLFLKGMKVLKVGFIKRNICHNAVCFAGQSTWNGYRKN